MRTHVQMYNPKDDSGLPPLPPAFVRDTQYIVNHATAVMRKFGVAKIAQNFMSLGPNVVSNVTFQPLPEQPDIPEYIAARGAVIRRLADEIRLYGILAIEIMPSHEEMGIIRKNWDMLKTGEGLPDAPDFKENVPLRVDTDPSGENVLQIGEHDADRPIEEPAPAQP